MLSQVLAGPQVARALGRRQALGEGTGPSQKPAGPLGSTQDQAGDRARARPAQDRPLEFIVEGIPISANNDRRAARAWKARVAAAAAECLGSWRFREAGELSALMILFHTGPYACDTDNIPKHVLDALTGLAFDDDRRVTHVVARRTRQCAGFEIQDPPPLVAENLGFRSHFLYVLITDGPDHTALPCPVVAD